MAKLLFIRYKSTKNIFEGGEQGSQKNYNVLAQLLGEENITTYYVHHEGEKHGLLTYLMAAWYMLWGYYWGMTPKRVRGIVDMAKDYDVVFVDRSVFGIIAKRLKKAGYKGKVISFFHNVEVLYFAAKVGKCNPVRPFLLRCVNANDRYACQYSDKIIALNPRDQKELENRYGRKADVLIPVAFRDRYNRPTYTEELTRKRPLCLFLGAYFPPNNEGILWFVQNVLPLVDVQIRIVGKGMVRLKNEEPLLKDIEVISDAPEVEPHFEDADLMVLPIFAGSGMKVKTCESLMYGKNIIATPEALEGYELNYNRMGACCTTAEEFVKAINSFIASPRPRFNAYCRQIFLRKYSEQAVVDRFRKVLE